MGFPDGAAVKNLPAYLCRRRKRRRFHPWVGKTPWRREWQLTPVFLPGESHGQRSLAGYSPCGCKSQSQLSTHTYTHTHAHARTRAHTCNLGPAFFFFNWSKLLYSVMLVSAVQKRESAVCIYVSPASWASLPSPAPSTPLSHHGTRNTLCAGQRLPSSCLSYTWWCVYISVTLPARPALLSPPCPMSDMLLVNFLVSKYRSQEAAVNTEERI